MKKISTMLAAGLLAIASIPASAATVTWYLNAIYDSGTTAKGQYDYDNATNTISNVSVSLSTGETLAAVNPISPGNAGILVAVESSGADGERTGLFDLESDMTGSGGTINILKSQYLSGGSGKSFLGDCATNCSDIVGPYEDIVSGTVSLTAPSAVPVPAAAWLFGSALIGLAGIGRKRRA